MHTSSSISHGLLGLLCCTTFILSACGGDSSNTLSANGSNSASALQPNQTDSNNAPVQIDTTCDTAAYPSPAFVQCEAQNVARTYEANTEQLNPAFQVRALQQQLVNSSGMLMRSINDPSWSLPPAFGNSPATPLCAAGMGPCVGDPFRYPGVDGPDGKRFYEQEAEVIPVVYYDQECARISGKVWRPRSTASSTLPAIVVKNGSVQAGEQLYWWAVQELVRAGYTVLTNDPRGQGASDFSTPKGAQGGNFNGAVFYEGLVNDIDFLLSSPNKPYPHEATCKGTYPTKTNPFNPFHAVVDAERIGLAGHSYGAGGVTWVQSYGAADSLPWPGKLTATNPVKVVVAWDALGSRSKPNAATLSSLPPFDAAEGLIRPSSAPPVSARVPAMSFTSEYGFTPVPFVRNPPRDEHLNAFKQWKESNQPVYALTIAGTTHLDYSLGYGLPASSWCPKVENNACVGGWARPMITHYTLAWFDRFLKNSGEPGFDTADQRLLDDAKWAERMSFHFASARSFSTREGQSKMTDDIRGLYSN
ncbi:MAG: hypothetical protein QE278_00950 [Limnobacter sp.]|nr:hypothetical protein [Limnobacter sp.]